MNSPLIIERGGVFLGGNMFKKDKEELKDWLGKLVTEEVKALKAFFTSPEPSVFVRNERTPDFSISIEGETYDYYSTKSDKRRIEYHWVLKNVKAKLYRGGDYCSHKSKPRLIETVKGGDSIGHKTEWYCANGTVKCSFDNIWQLVAMVNVVLGIRDKGMEYTNFQGCHVALVKKSEEHFLSRPSDWDW